MTAILEPPTATRSPAPVVRPRPVLPPVVPPPAPPREPEAREPEPRIRRTLTPTGVRLLGAAMAALFAIALAIEPVPDGPAPVLSLAEELLATAMTLGIAAALVGFVRGRRWSLWPALGVSAALAVGVALCPTTGHHQLAGWWFGQVAIAAVMLALPAVALARTRAG